MNNYAIMIWRKIKSDHEMDSSYMHNERIYAVENADPALQSENRELIDSFGQSYSDLYQQTLAEMKSLGVNQRTIRSDAVKGLEVMLTFSRERSDDISLDQWVDANMEWLDKTFNPPDHEIHVKDKETGEERTHTVQNLKHVILHMDENSPHIHAFVVPVDDRGHLNAHYYDKGRYHLRALQSQYAKEMERFGLERGEKYSVATQEQRSRYYAHLTKAVDARLPEPKEKEKIQDYRTRCEEVYQRALSNHRNEIVKKDQEIIHVRSEAAGKLIEARKEHAEEKELLEDLFHASGREDGLLRERGDGLVKDVTEHRQLEEALNEHPDREFAEQMRNNINGLILWQREKERKKELEEMQKRDDESSRDTQSAHDTTR